MIDPDKIFDANKALYVICAVAMVVIYLDLFYWRP